MLVPRVSLSIDTNGVNGDQQNGFLVWNTNPAYKIGLGFYFWAGNNWTALAQNINSVNYDEIVPSSSTINIDAIFAVI